MRVTYNLPPLNQDPSIGTRSPDYFGAPQPGLSLGDSNTPDGDPAGGDAVARYNQTPDRADFANYDQPPYGPEQPQPDEHNPASLGLGLQDVRASVSNSRSRLAWRMPRRTRRPRLLRLHKLLPRKV